MFCHIAKGLWLTAKGILLVLGLISLVSMIVGFWAGIKAATCGRDYAE